MTRTEISAKCYAYRGAGQHFIADWRTAEELSAPAANMAAFARDLSPRGSTSCPLKTTDVLALGNLAGDKLTRDLATPGSSCVRRKARSARAVS